MANKTLVKFDKVFNSIRIFKITSPSGLIQTLWISSLKNGFATIEMNPTIVPVPKAGIVEVCSVIAGCFSEESNFSEEVCSAFGQRFFNGIKFHFDGIECTIVKINSSVDNIYAEWFWKKGGAR